MADLPPCRLQMFETPFAHTGVDYFGPFLVKQRRSEIKRYGCIFTCMTTRAIHLEVAPDLTVSSFLNAFRRFVSRRGPIQCMYSDNGTNFVGSEKVLRQSIEAWNKEHINSNLRQRGILWKFNPPGASHMGGSWERMIRTVRQLLEGSISKRDLDDDALHTLFLEVEAMINSRPLTDVSVDVNAELPLTPNHLLRVDPSIGLPPMLTDAADNYARQRYRIVQLVADEFWKRWVEEYPRTLFTRRKWNQRRDNIALDDIVLIMDHFLPRGQWPLGRVVKLYPDSLGVVRIVDVKAATGVLKRPISKLCVIVKSNSDEQVEANLPSHVPEGADSPADLSSSAG